MEELSAFLPGGNTCHGPAGLRGWGGRVHWHHFDRLLANQASSSVNAYGNHRHGALLWKMQGKNITPASQRPARIRLFVAQFFIDHVVRVSQVRKPITKPVKPFGRP